MRKIKGLFLILPMLLFLAVWNGCALFSKAPEPSPDNSGTEKEKTQISTGKANKKLIAMAKKKKPATTTLPEKNAAETGKDSPVKNTEETDDKEKKAEGPYLLQEGDVLEISILDEPEMTRDVAVIPDGSITYLLVGELPARGKTIGLLRGEIEKALLKYYKAPHVSILMKKLHDEKLEEEKEEKKFASIIGALKSPGKYEISKGDRVIDLIASAGGFLYINDGFGGRRISNLKASYLSRGDKIMDIDFYRLFEFGDMESNIELQPNDFIFIANAESETVYVMGEVNSPQIIPFNRDISIIEALSMSGGFTEDAQRSRVVIVRGFDGQGTVNVDVEALLLGDPKQKNIRLKAGDIVFVPEQGLSEYSRYAGYLTIFADLILKGYEAREAIRFPKLHRRDSH